MSKSYTGQHLHRIKGKLEQEFDNSCESAKKLKDGMNPEKGSLKQTSSNETQQKGESKKNSVKNNGKKLVNQGKTQRQSKKQSKNNSKSRCTVMVNKLIPIIQTRGMKAKNLKTLSSKNNPIIDDRDISEFNEIDGLTSIEILEDDRILEEEDEATHDNVDLSIQGSDIDDFPEKSNKQVASIRQESYDKQTNNGTEWVDETEPGELSSDGEYESLRPCKRVASKVTRVRKDSTQTREG